MPVTKESKAAHRRAVDLFDCPKCGKKAGQPCVAKSGGWKHPDYDVHQERMALSEMDKTA